MSSCEDDQMENQEFRSHSLSRLATCTTSNSTIDLENFDNFDDDGVKTMLSRLSIDSFDADGELSDGDYAACGLEEFEDDKVPAAGACYSLPFTPLQRRSLFGNFIKQYASENDDDQKARRNERRRRRKRRVLLRRENWEERETMKDDEDDDSVVRKMEMNQFYSSSFSGESENGGGLRVITRPKGGKRSLCMDMEEVKACRELGFELEFDMATMPSRLNLSASTLDTTSSGGSSPISNWRISSPGDDPKDVKARLKVWAQAVALASTSPQILSS